MSKSHSSDYNIVPTDHNTVLHAKNSVKEVDLIFLPQKK